MSVDECAEREAVLEAERKVKVTGRSHGNMQKSRLKGQGRLYQNSAKSVIYRDDYLLDDITNLR